MLINLLRNSRPIISSTRKYFYVVLVITFFFEDPLLAQQALIDSLRNEIRINQTQDTAQADRLINVARLLYRSDPDLARQYSEQAISLAAELNETRREAIANRYNGFTYWIQGAPDTALTIFQRSLELYTSIDDLRGIANANSSIATMYAIQNEVDIAVSYFLNVLKVYEELESHYEMGAIYVNIGNIYIQQQETEKGLEYFQKALSLYIQEDVQPKSRYLPIYTNLAQALITLDRLDEAIEFVQKGLEEVEESTGLLTKAQLNHMAGKIQFEKSEYEEAQRFFGITLKIYEQLESKRRMIDVWYDLSKIEFELENYSSAKKYLEDTVLELDNHTGMDVLKNSSYERLARVELLLGNSEDAFRYLDISKTLSDSLLKEENTKKIAELETIYETEKKENQILLLQAESETKTMRMYLISIIALFVLIATVLGFRKQQKRRAELKKRELRSLKMELENFGTLIMEKDKFMTQLQDRLEEVKTEVKGFETKRELNKVVDSLSQNLQLSEEEDKLFKRIDQVNAGFFHELRKKSSSITKKDERLASLIQMGLSNKDIASVLHIELTSVKQAKRRLKKKLNLGPEYNIKRYLTDLEA